MAMRSTIAVSLLAFTVLLVGSGDGLGGASPQHEHPTPGSAAAATQGMPAKMMMMHEEMMADMKAADAKLDALVATMNTATGDDRIVAVTAVVNELARQQRGMHARMGEMHQMMDGRAMSK